MFRDAAVEGQRRAFELGDVIEKGFACGEAALARPRAWHAAVALLLLLQSALIVTHSAWLDEWQALQIALQSPSLGALLENLRYEGHPPLWYLLLRFVGLAMPYLWVLAATQFLVAVGMQALILLRAPFGRLERVMIGCSYFILFEFGTISRGLGLGTLLTIGFFAARDKRSAWAMLILLPMVDFLFGLLSIVGIVLTIRDRRFSPLGAGLWLASSLFAAWTILPAPDMRTALQTPHPLIGMSMAIDHFSALLIPFQTLNNEIAWGGGLPWIFGPIGGALFLIFVLRESSPVRLHAWLFRGFLAAVVAFELFVYPITIRHLTLIPLLLILLKWREVESGGTLDPMFRAWLAVIAAGGLAAVAISIDRPFDTAPQVAKFIQSRNLQDKHWVSFPDSMAQGVAGLMDRELETLPKGCTQSFIRWNVDDPRKDIRDAADLDEALRKIATDYGRFYLISNLDFDSRVTVPFRQIARFPAGYDARPYYLYIVAPGLPESVRRPPPCAPSRIPLSAASLLH